MQTQTTTLADSAADSAPLPFAGYIRVSRVGGRSGDSFISPETQRESIERTARQFGLVLSEVVTELDVSGGKQAEARELGRLVQAVKDGELGGVIVWNVKRYSREWADGLAVFDSILNAGGRLYAEDFRQEGLLARTMLSALLELAEEERRQRTDGWERTGAALIERGIHSGNTKRPPAGYSWPTDAKGKKSGPLALTPEAPAWREMFERFAAHDVSGVEAASTLGVKLNVWKAACRSRVYLGTAFWKNYSKDGAHPALMTVETWNAIQARLDSQAALHEDTAPVGAPLRSVLALSKVLRCSSSGRMMSMQKSGSWQCSAGKRGECDCGGRSIADSADLLAAVVAAATGWHRIESEQFAARDAIRDAIRPVLDENLQKARRAHKEAEAAVEALGGALRADAPTALAVEKALSDLRDHEASQGWLARTPEQVAEMVAGGSVEDLNGFLRETVSVLIPESETKHPTKAQKAERLGRVEFVYLTGGKTAGGEEPETFFTETPAPPALVGVAV